MALTEELPKKKIAEDFGSGSSESSEEGMAMCKISPLTAIKAHNDKSEETTADESNDCDVDVYDDDNDDDDELVIDESKTFESDEIKTEKAKEKVEYKRQVSAPLKKRKLPPPAEEKPASVKDDDEDDDPTTSGLPPGWTRKITERMSGASAGKFDVYLTSPEGKRCRSMKEVGDHLEKTKSSYTVSDFAFKPKNFKATATPAAIKTPSRLPARPAKKSPKKSPARSPAKKPAKRSNSTERRGRPKKAKAEEEEEKVVKQRKKRSPSKSAALQKKKAKEPRQVRKPPPEKASVKASKQQKFQKLLVKINFQQKGMEDSDLESEEDNEEDSFDEGSEPEEMEIPTTPPKRSPRGSRNSHSD